MLYTVLASVTTHQIAVNTPFVYVFPGSQKWDLLCWLETAVLARIFNPLGSSWMMPFCSAVTSSGANKLCLAPSETHCIQKCSSSLFFSGKDIFMKNCGIAPFDPLFYIDAAAEIWYHFDIPALFNQEKHFHNNTYICVLF